MPLKAGVPSVCGRCWLGDLFARKGVEELEVPLRMLRPWFTWQKWSFSSHSIKVQATWPG